MTYSTKHKVRNWLARYKARHSNAERREIVNACIMKVVGAGSQDDIRACQIFLRAVKADVERGFVTGVKSDPKPEFQLPGSGSDEPDYREDFYN